MSSIWPFRRRSSSRSVNLLCKARMHHPHDRVRLVVEKPFGSDLDSARRPEQAAAQAVRGDARSSESITTSARRRSRTSWPSASPTRCSSRSGTAATSITCRSPSPRRLGVEHRGVYYEHAGALRDMIQNHLLQVFSLVAMEPPVSFDADEIRDRKLDVLKAVRPIPIDEVHDYAVRGQYSRGLARGREGAWLSTRRTAWTPDSKVETFAALEAVRRQLALAGRAVLSPNRQADGGEEHRPSPSCSAPCRTRPFRGTPSQAGSRTGW